MVEPFSAKSDHAAVTGGATEGEVGPETHRNDGLSLRKEGLRGNRDVTRARKLTAEEQLAKETPYESLLVDHSSVKSKPVTTDISEQLNNHSRNNADNESVIAIHSDDNISEHYNPSEEHYNIPSRYEKVPSYDEPQLSAHDSQSFDSSCIETNEVKIIRGDDLINKDILATVSKLEDFITQAKVLILPNFYKLAPFRQWQAVASQNLPSLTTELHQAQEQLLNEFMTILDNSPIPYLAVEFPLIEYDMITFFKAFRFIDNIRLLNTETIDTTPDFVPSSGRRFLIFKRKGVQSRFRFRSTPDVLKGNDLDDQLVMALSSFTMSNDVYTVDMFLSRIRVTTDDWLEVVNVRPHSRRKYLPENTTVEIEDSASFWEPLSTLKSLECAVEEVCIFGVDQPKPLILEPESDDSELQQLEQGFCDEDNTSQQDGDEASVLIQLLDEKLAEIDSLDDARRAKLRKVYIDNIKAFAVTQSKCRMSKLTPIRVELVKDAPPINQPARLMSFQKLQWLKGKIADLVKIKMLAPEPNPLFGSPVFLVPKRGPKKYRMVVDLRLLNKYTRKTSLTLPHLENQLCHVKNSKYFASLDVLSGFDFLPVEESSQTKLTVSTPFGAYRMCGAPMGWTNTAQLFQARIMQEVLNPLNFFCRLNDGCLQWLDDTLIYSSKFEALLSMLDKLLKQFLAKRVRLNLQKCVLFATKINYCGRVINGTSWQFEEKYWTKILKTRRPRYAHELAQVIYVAQWLSNAIPRLAEIRSKFAHITNLQGLTKKELAAKNVLIDWTKDLATAWDQFLKAIAAAAEKALAQYDPEKEIVIIADASSSHWATVIMQAEEPLSDNEHVKFKDLKLVPLVFLSGAFQKGQKKWHIGQKEVYGIIHAFSRCKYLVVNPDRTVNIFTDHQALTHILNPKSLGRRTITIDCYDGF